MVSSSRMAASRIPTEYALATTPMAIRCNEGMEWSTQLRNLGGADSVDALACAGTREPPMRKSGTGEITATPGSIL